MACPAVYVEGLCAMSGMSRDNGWVAIMLFRLGFLMRGEIDDTFERRGSRIGQQSTLMHSFASLLQIKAAR